MIEDFDEFCLYVYVIVDEIYQRLAPLLKRPGPTPVCSDSELIAMTLISECKRWDVETELLSNWQSHRDLFPHTLPRKNQKKQLPKPIRKLFNAVRQIIETVNGQLDGQYSITRKLCLL